MCKQRGQFGLRRAAVAPPDEGDLIGGAAEMARRRRRDPAEFRQRRRLIGLGFDRLEHRKPLFPAGGDLLELFGEDRLRIDAAPRLQDTLPLLASKIGITAPFR